MSKLTKVDMSGSISYFAGCALTGTCATAAAEYVKQVTLTDGDIVADGMFVAVTFSEGNSAGSAPTAQTVYSSDQETYYSDAGLTVPVTLPPAGCYDIEYTGSGNIYTLLTYPEISVSGVSGPLCNSFGRYIGGAVWTAGDVLILLYTCGKFLAVNL